MISVSRTDSDMNKGGAIQSCCARVNYKSVGKNMSVRVVCCVLSLIKKRMSLCTLCHEYYYNDSSSVGLYGWDVIYHAQHRLTALHR